VTAINMDRGEILWKIANADTPDSIKNHPALKGLDIPRTGRIGVFSVLVTKTLFITGERSAGNSKTMLRAFDKATGADAGAIAMPAGQTGGFPMTYMLNGTQYIVETVGGRGYGAGFVAYKLPSPTTRVTRSTQSDRSPRELEFHDLDHC
jgi:quinoprotein glucose dehydrogenase